MSYLDQSRFNIFLRCVCILWCHVFFTAASFFHLIARCLKFIVAALTLDLWKVLRSVQEYSMLYVMFPRSKVSLLQIRHEALASGYSVRTWAFEQVYSTLQIVQQ